jgi:uncharacterized protein (TIGR02145 family)
MIGYLDNDQEFIKKLNDIILANLGDELFGVNELIRESGMSRQSLNQRLQAIIHKPINQFIRETRLQKALEMLLTGKVTVSEAAYKVGFGSPAYFITCFHDYFGYTPGLVKKISPENTNEINQVRVETNHEKRRSSRRTFIFMSSGILLLAILAFLFFSKFIGHSPLHAVDNIIKDVDGNIYHSVTIGTQDWFAEDLKTTRYNDGTPILYVTDTAEWGSLHTGAYCWANNDESTKDIYGALYNWYTTDLGKLCPAGWHVSNNNDWERLVDYCGGWEIAGGKLKEAGTAHWEAPNLGATNEFGFTALPAGGRGCNGKFSVIGRDLGYWCPPRCGDFRSLCSDRTWIYLTESVACEACCVRCVRN